MKFKITVVTVTFNARITLEQTILSVINQNDIELEYIVIDGGSNDGTIDIINKYRRNIFYWESSKDNGIYDAMNKSLNHASSEWIIFMNSGDKFYDNNTLSNIYKNFLRSKNDYDIIYGNYSFISNEKLIIKYPYHISTIWKRIPMCHQSIIFKTELLKERPYNLDYKFCADYYFLYNEYLNFNKKFIYVDYTISTISRNGFSETNSIETYKEYMKISLSLNYNLLKRLYFIFKVNERKIIYFMKKLFKYNNV